MSINVNTKEQKLRTDMLISGKDEEAITSLGWLRSATGYPSPKSFIEVIEKLEEIRALKLKINMQGLHPNRIRQLSKLGSKYEPHSFRMFDENKRYAILAVYLYELSQSLIDKAIEMHDKQINQLLSKGRKKHQLREGKRIKKIIYLEGKLSTYVELG